MNAPIEYPTRWALGISRWSMSRITSIAISVPYSPRSWGLSLCPCPRQSRAMTRKPGRGASFGFLAASIPHMVASPIQPWTRTTGSPSPAAAYRILTPFESKKPISVEGPAGWAAPRPKKDRISRENAAP